jgi:protein-S-isoprenylcysteine O-methyltransferase Ste14
MLTATRLILLCWIIFIVYWGISARSVKPTAERRRQLMTGFWPLMVRIGIALIFWACVTPHPLPPLTNVLSPSSGVVDVISVALTILGLAVAFIARRTLAANWSGNVELKVDHELITTGVYRLSRHPIYTGMLLMTVGTALATGRVSSMLLLLALLSFLLYKAREEELLLLEHFHTEYLAYRRRVKMIIPFVL